MDRQQQLIFGGLAAAIVLLPFYQARSSLSTMVIQFVAFVGALLAVALVKRRRAKPPRRFTWPWIVGGAIVGATLFSAASLFFLPQPGYVFNYAISRGVTPERLDEMRAGLLLAAALGRGIGLGLMFGLAMTSFSYAFGILESPATIQDHLHFPNRRKT